MSILSANPAAEAMVPILNDATSKPMPPWPSPMELRKLPRQVQERILAASAEMAEEEYRTNKDLTDFEAFAEEP